MQRIGARIREARKAKGLSQSDLAEALDVTKGAISQWETGQTDLSITRLDAIARVLAVEVEWLRAGKGPPHPVGDATMSAGEWRTALTLAEVFSEQLVAQGLPALDATEKVALAERLSPYLARYLKP